MYFNTAEADNKANKPPFPGARPQHNCYSSPGDTADWARRAAASKSNSYYPLPHKPAETLMLAKKIQGQW